MKQRFSLVRTALCALGLGASLLTACGGRFQTVHEVEDDAVSGGSNRGGASSIAGSGSIPRAGGSGAGASSGGASTGGVSSAGSGGGGSTTCAIPICPAGYLPVILPGARCATCGPSCPPCPKISCPAGTHSELLPGGCCPVCIDDGEAACQMGLQTYATLREQFLTKYSYGCASDHECVTIAPLNLCEQGCSYVAVWSGVADSFDSNLANAAGMYCSSCKQGPIPPCAPPPPPRCISGQCGYLPK